MVKAVSIYPWQTRPWQQLLHAKRTERLPHAILLTGVAGSGKVHFAECVTRTLVCQKETMDCDCHDCRLLANRVHPNVLWVEPESAGHAIKIDQIRDLAEFVQQTSFAGHYRIVLINPADKMNMHAANALLKTLEEPAAGAILILMTDQPSRLPATIISRCQRFAFSEQQALAWLQAELKDPALNAELLLRIAHGGPLAAKKLVKDGIYAERKALFTILAELTTHLTDPLRAAEALQSMELTRILDFTLSWIMDLLRVELGVTTLVNTDFTKELNQAATRTDLAHKTRLLNTIQHLRVQINTGINLNKQLLIENILVAFAHVSG